ncbi:MAG: M48 family metalloprotease [Nanoarchaeota archaeon]
MIHNQLKTVLLLGALTALLMVVGGILGGSGGLLLGLIMAFLMNILTFWFSDKIVLWMYGAKEVNPKNAPRLHKLVDKAVHAVGIPKPKVYMIHSQAPNAFATGRSPSHAAIAATEGILMLLDDEELVGVLAHEASHIRNRDTLVATIAACIAGLILYVGSIVRWTALFGSDRDDKGSGLELLVLGILTPLLALLLQLAISRSREYLADETGARAIKNPKALAHALQKLHKGVAMVPWMGNSTAASLFIVNPFSGQALLSLLSTHPPMEKRIARLNEIKF